jgi:hypothetical protein
VHVHVPLGLTILEQRPDLVLDQYGEFNVVTPSKREVEIGLTVGLRRKIVGTLPLIDPCADALKLNAGQTGTVLPGSCFRQEPPDQVVVHAQLLGEEEIEPGLSAARDTDGFALGGTKRYVHARFRHCLSLRMILGMLASSRERVTGVEATARARYGGARPLWLTRERPIRHCSDLGTTPMVPTS